MDDISYEDIKITDLSEENIKRIFNIYNEYQIIDDNKNNINNTEEDLILKDAYSKTSSDLKKSNNNSILNNNDNMINKKESILDTLKYNINSNYIKYLVSPMGLLNGENIECYEDYLIFEGMRYNLTKREVDIKKL